MVLAIPIILIFVPYTYNIQAWRELGLILIVVAITMLMFSTLLFAFESDGPAPEVATFFESTQRNLSMFKTWELISWVLILFETVFQRFGVSSTASGGV